MSVGDKEALVDITETNDPHPTPEAGANELGNSHVTSAGYEPIHGGQLPQQEYHMNGTQPMQASVTQQPVALRPVRTSREFSFKTLGDNQFYMSLALIALSCICCNPLALICGIPGFLTASKAANANDSGQYDVARRYHKRAMFWNIGGAATLILFGSGVALLGYLSRQSQASA